MPAAQHSRCGLFQVWPAAWRTPATPPPHPCTGGLNQRGESSLQSPHGAAASSASSTTSQIASLKLGIPVSALSSSGAAGISATMRDEGMDRVLDNVRLFKSAEDGHCFLTALPHTDPGKLEEILSKWCPPRGLAYSVVPDCGWRGGGATLVVVTAPMSFYGWATRHCGDLEDLLGKAYNYVKFLIDDTALLDER